MNVRQLRAKHAVFHYQSFDLSQAQTELRIRFNFLLEPDIRFQPEVHIPLVKPVDEAVLAPLIFNLGLVEAISYWKATCSPVFQVSAGPLDQDQIAWWHDLFTHGLGEFFYINNIDFTEPNFLTLDARVTRVGGPPRRGPLVGVLGGKPAAGPAAIGDLILVGGGKDSVVTLEQTSSLAKRRGVLLLNPTPAMLKVAKLAGFKEPLIIKRTIDASLLKLNHRGYLNGHTPFSAYLAFLSLLVGQIYGFKQIIASNEESASSGNITFHGLAVNHQYSKSYHFEKMFRDYCRRYLAPVPEYFSFLRPLNELQIAWLFTQHHSSGAGFSLFQKYFSVFNSCNVGRGVRWCGRCPKCAFVFLVLSPFVETDKLIRLFGEDLFDNQALEPTFLALVGLNGHKPFDCVGTQEESAQAVALTMAKYQKEGRARPKVLSLLQEKLLLKESVTTDLILTELKSHWNSEHFLPKKYATVLQAALKI